MSACGLFDIDGEAVVNRYTNNFDFKQQKWTPVDAGVKDNLNALQLVGASTGYVVGDNGLVLKTEDGGASWQAGYPSAMTGQKLLSVSFVSPAEGYVASAKLLYRTQDGGKTWGEQSRFADDQQDALASITFVTAGAGYAVGAKRSYQTLDAGKTWQPLALQNVKSFTSTGAEVFAGGGNVYRAQVGAGWTGLLSAEHACDSCAAWLAFTTPSKGWSVITGTKSYGTTGGLAVLRTTDGGDTWANLPVQDYQGKSLEGYLGGISYDTVRALRFVDDQGGWMLYGGGLLSTYDGGQTWVEQQQAFADLIGQRFSSDTMGTFFPSCGFNALDATDGSHVWVAGNAGRLYKFGGESYPPFHEK